MFVFAVQLLVHYSSSSTVVLVSIRSSGWARTPMPALVPTTGIPRAPFAFMHKKGACPRFVGGHRRAGNVQLRHERDFLGAEGWGAGGLRGTWGVFDVSPAGSLPHG